MAARKKRKENPEAEQRARVAKELIENEVLKSALDAIESSALYRCRTSTSPESSWRATLSCQAIQELRSMLHAILKEGEDKAREISEANEQLAQAREDDRAARANLTAARAARAANGAATRGDEQ